uniref:non-specific serine/threonine protein kinase n=1 Tax=Hirondellea gigas TaxID=1518452 RepID=A0A2P2I2Y3_9CRUS
MKDLICQGAEARVYQGTWINKTIILKHRFSKKYRHPDLDKHITKERLKSEARSLVRCRMAGIRTPCVYHVDFITNEIIMEKIENSATVRSVIKQYTEASDEAGSDELSSNMKTLAVKIGKVLSKLHQNHIIHGDLTTSNMLLVEPYYDSPVILIDFGLSSMEEKAEDKAVDLYVLERAILSTHRNTDLFVSSLLAEYKKSGGKAACNVIAKLEEVRMRGKKKLCFG